ncbi:MAG TPA: S8 family serine peptidase, partial [Gemmatimonadales bacterium]|nr:S8 family serine peptidase [Gemmatimonadales bacterium]
MKLRLAAGLLLGAWAATGLGQSLPAYSTWDADIINTESVSQTGAGVYVAVLDTGLVPYWRDYFPQARIAEDLGTGFDQSVTFKAKGNPCEFDVEVGQLRQTTWVGSIGSTHGTHVTSTIVGYNYRSNFDAIAGFPLPPIYVKGIAPGATVIPVKVLADYQVPALPKCTDPGPTPAQGVVFGTSGMVAAGIDYATNLAIAGRRPMVINMSLGGPELSAVEKAAIDRAIANGVIVVVAAGNEGETGMSFPGAYPPVISAGAAGWTGEWLFPGDGPRYRMWWLKYPFAPLLPGSGEVADPTVAGDVYVTDFSSRALLAQGQELDVLAPGSWVRGPFPGDPGYSRLPWYSRGVGDLHGAQTNFFYVGGTSMATPHVTGVAALLKAQDPSRDWRTIKNLILAGAEPAAALSATITGGRLNALNALTCTGRNLQSRLLPRETATATPGYPLTLAAVNIVCGVPAGDVVVTVS